MRCVAARTASACTAAQHGAVAVRRGLTGLPTTYKSVGALYSTPWRGRPASTLPVAGWGCLQNLSAGCARSSSQPRLLSVGFVEWSDAEDAALSKLVEAAGGYSPELDWSEIAELLGTGRAAPALAHRWDHLAREAYARAEAEADAKDAEWGAVKNGEWNGPVGPEPTRCACTASDPSKGRRVISHRMCCCRRAGTMTGSRRGAARIFE